MCGGQGKSTVTGRGGRPASSDETVAVQVPCPNVPLPSPHPVGPAIPPSLPVKPAVVQPVCKPFPSLQRCSCFHPPNSKKVAKVVRKKQEGKREEAKTKAR